MAKTRHEKERSNNEYKDDESLLEASGKGSQPCVYFAMVSSGSYSSTGAFEQIA